MEIIVSKTWFSHGLEQVKSITSKHITTLLAYHWLHEEEEPSNEVWVELDGILNTDKLKPLTRVEVGCVHRDSERVWHYADNFEKSKFPTLLPIAFKRGILRS